MVLLTTQPAVAENEIFTVVSATDGADLEVSYSLEDLDGFPQKQILTANDFVDGIEAFTGPLARDVLEHSGISLGKRLRMIASNLYFIDVPVTDLMDYDVVLATRQNGQLFSSRDKGPIWLIYPMSEHNELQDSIYNARLIWQLVRAEVLPD